MNLKRISITLTLLVIINCASTPRRTAINYTQVLFTALQTARDIADAAFVAKQISSEDRIIFSKIYLVPALELNKQILIALKALFEYLGNRDKDDSEVLTNMITQIDAELDKQKKIASGDLSGI